MNVKSKNKGVIITIIATVCVLVIVGGILFYVFSHKKDEPIIEPDSIQTDDLPISLTQDEMLNDVAKDFSIKIKSNEDTDKSQKLFSILDQNGCETNAKIVWKGDEGTIMAPDGGYNEGFLYKVKLLQDNISFMDENVSNNREISFSIGRPNVEIIEEKFGVITVDSNEKVYSIDGNGILIVDNTFINKYSVQVGSIITIPVYDEYGFVVQQSYKVENITGNSLQLCFAKFDEVFNNLDIKKEYNAVYEPQYFHFANDDEVVNEVLNNEAIQMLSAYSESKQAPTVKLDVALKGSSVNVKLTIVIVKFFDGLNLKVIGDTTITLGADADINLRNGTFKLVGKVGYECSTKFELEAKYEAETSPSILDKASKKLTDILTKKLSKKELSPKLFDVYIPTPIACLGFSFEVHLNFKFEAKAELGITFTDSFSLEVGVKRDSDGINSFFNKESKREVANIKLCGQVEGKIGLEVKFAGSLAGILEAGVSFEIGAYARIVGFVEAEALADLSATNFNNDSEAKAGVYYGAYFETGIYSDLSIFAKVDLIVFVAEAKYTILEVELPIFSIGYTQQIDLSVQSNTLLLQGDKPTALPEITITTKDMIEKTTTEKKVNGKEIIQLFNINCNNPYFYVNSDDGTICLKNDSTNEFEESIEFNLKAWQNFVSSPTVSVKFGEPSGPAISIKLDKAIFHLELGAIKVNTKITVTRNPIGVENITLGFEQIVDDLDYATLHKDLSEEELTYNVRDEINGIKDFQIGRLVRIIPTIIPANATYKSLVYSIAKGSEYIVGGESGIKTYNHNGVTFAEFRIVGDEEAIGNILGEINEEKGIQIVATTNGYQGKYIDWNKSNTDDAIIYASGIPVTNYEFSPTIESENVAQTKAECGDIISFGIDDKTVYPKNATRGECGAERITVNPVFNNFVEEQGNNQFKIKDDVEVGTQIEFLASLSGEERSFFITIIKRAVEVVEITDNYGTNKILPKQEIEIEANILAKNGGKPSISECQFVVIKGNECVTLVDNGINKVKLIGKENAPINSEISVIAIVDGKRSNTLTYIVDKVPVQSIVLSTTNNLLVDPGANVSLNAVVTPTNSIFNQVRYVIVEGMEYATIDSLSGNLSVKISCKGNEIIKVKCVADDVYSNEITFTVKSSPVIFLMFPKTSIYLTNGETFILDAYVNSDATNQTITYEIIEGNEFATLSGNRLTINNNVSSGEYLMVKATSNDYGYEPMLEVIIVEHRSIMMVNGQVDETEMLLNSTATINIYDNNGLLVDNSLVEFSAIASQSSTLGDFITISNDGVISFDKKALGYSSDVLTDEMRTFTITAIYNGNTYEIELFAHIPMSQFALIERGKSFNDNSARLKPNESIDLDVYCGNGVLYDDYYLEVEGNAEIGLFTSTGEYQFKVKVNSDAKTGDKIKVYCIGVLSGLKDKSACFTITVDRLIETVSIVNAPQKLNVGEHIFLNAIPYPYTTGYDIEYKISGDPSGILNQETGEFYFNCDNPSLILGATVTVYAYIDGVRSVDYVISATQEVTSLILNVGSESKGVQFIEEMGFYMLYPNGKLKLDLDIEGGVNKVLGIYPAIKYSLDKIGCQYLDINNGVITVKKGVKINSGINATVVAYSENGKVSNLIMIYIPQSIYTVEDWYDISKNISGFYVLANNLDFVEEDYTPIHNFSGIIDGNGFKLYNVHTTDLNTNNCFGLLECNYGMIINLTVAVKAMNITKATYKDKIAFIGTICAKNYGYIINCTSYIANPQCIYCSIKNAYIGGICAENNGTIRKCNNLVYFEVFSTVGGIAGINEKDGKIIDCSNNDTISTFGTIEESEYQGIVGENRGSITNCRNYGKINIR